MFVFVFRQCCSNSPRLNTVAWHWSQQCSTASLTVTYVHRRRHLTSTTSTGYYCLYPWHTLNKLVQVSCNIRCKLMQFFTN